LAACLAWAQANPEFEVASVKPSTGRVALRGGPRTAEPERIAYENADLRQLLMKAYGVESDQISGPAWVDSERYTINAKIPPGTTVAQFQTMLQNLLTERFRLKVHHEMKELSVYELTVAKGSAKLTPAAAKDPNDTDNEGCPVVRPGVSSDSGTFGPGVSCSRFNKTSMAELARTLEGLKSMEDGEFGQNFPHVVDRTGIEGEFDITLKFHLAMKFPGQVSTPGQASDPDGVDGPSLTTALEQQLGLILQKTKATLDRIVIDSADKVPVEN